MAATPGKERYLPAKPKYWFPAKAYGWGWGIPSTWQGWLVIAAYISATCALVVSFKHHLITRDQRLTLVGVSTLAFMLVCWCKGEPPRWRWGKD